nr:hypothetical protein [Flavilitoribacter sp.]
GLAGRLDLRVMKPVKAFQSGFCLADEGREYVIYMRKGTAEVDLTGISGVFRVEWIHPAVRLSQPGKPVMGGAKVRIPIPFSDDGILHLKKTN